MDSDVLILTQLVAHHKSYQYYMDRIWHKVGGLALNQLVWEVWNYKLNGISMQRVNGVQSFTTTKYCILPVYPGKLATTKPN